MLRPILLVPDPRLKLPCAPVTAFDKALQTLICDLTDTMEAGPACVGIAACQIGELMRVALVDTSGHSKHGAHSHGRLIVVNPQITARQGDKVGREGCLSLPDFTANVRRAQTISARFQTETGAWRELELSGFEAVAFQHEVDHLDGILFLDRVANLATDVFPRKNK